MTQNKVYHTKYQGGHQNLLWLTSLQLITGIMFMSRIGFSKVLLNRKYFKCRQPFGVSSTWLHQICGKVILTNIINTAGGTSVACDVWHMECHTDDMTDNKAMHAYDTT